MATADVSVHVYHHLVPDVAGTTVADQILAQLVSLGADMSALSDTVDQILASETAEDEASAQALAAKDAVIADLQAQLADIGGQLIASQANDAVDAQTIADKQAELDAQAADTQAQIDRLNAAFPQAENPPPQ